MALPDRSTLPPAAAGDAASWTLSADGLAARRGERLLFERLDLRLAPGSVTWLRGRNGRGKTTLLRLLAGIGQPESGTVCIAGRSLREEGPAWRRRLLFVAHHNALNHDLQAGEALRFLARLHGLPDDDASLAHALERMGIGARRRAAVRTLSQGQRRRVALARLALAERRALWLLDEPFDALDAEGCAALNALVAEHAVRGGTVLLTSHQALTLARPVAAELDLDRHAPA